MYKTNETKKVPVFWVLVIMSSFYTTAADKCSPIGFKKQHVGHRLDGNVIKDMKLGSLNECAKQCFYITKCRSLSFCQAGARCLLHDVDSRNFNSMAFVKDPKFVFTDLSVWPKGMVPACADKPCLETERCFPAGTKHTCTKYCVSPLPLEHGAVVSEDGFDGAVAKYSCVAGYTLFGSVKATCKSGTWTWSKAGAAKCLKDCASPKAPSNGQVLAPNYYDGETATYTCDFGYRLIGSATATCVSGEWSSSLPFCEGPRTCLEAKQCNASLTDSEYWLFPVSFSGSKIKVYCHNMQTDNPKEYITLYYKNEVSACSTAEECTDTTFSKIGINITDMTVVQDDTTFATSNTSSYASASTCSASSISFTVDTIFTGLVVDPALQWEFTTDITRHYSNRYIKGNCTKSESETRDCIKCRPIGAMNLQFGEQNIPDSKAVHPCG